MKILHYNVLFIILIGYVIAGGDVNSRFRDAIGRKDLGAALEVWGANKTYYDDAKDLVRRASTEFIIEFAKRAQPQKDIVAALYTSGTEAIRSEVFKKVSLDEEEFANVPSNPEILCQPRHFLDLLRRLMDRIFKLYAIELGILELFTARRTKCIVPLLNALKGDKDLEYKVVQETFSHGVFNGDKTWVERFYDHPIITSNDYAGKLIRLAREKGTNDPIFKFLLKEADQDDLKTLLNRFDYKRLDFNIRFFFDSAIEENLPNIKPAGSRRSIAAPKDYWRKRYLEEWKSRLYMVLTKGFDSLVNPHFRTMPMYIKSSQFVLPFLRDNGNIGSIREVLMDTGKTPLDMYNALVEKLHPEFAELAKDYYKEQRCLSESSNDFNEFDVRFYRKLGALTKSFPRGIKWNKLAMLFSKGEVMCEAAFFYDLIDFERAITCLDAAPPTPLTCRVFSNFVADMYFGEASRPDFSYEGDVETRKWLDGMVKKYEGSQHSHTSSLMRRFTQNIRDKVDDRLWSDYMRAMMTVHLSAAIIQINVSGLKDLYDYLADNNIQDEFMFASEERDPPQPGQTVQRGHSFLRTFKLDPSGDTATMSIINSGDGLQFHANTRFNLSELPDTISNVPHTESVIRFIPFIVYDEVPRSTWEPAYTTTYSADKAYFEHKQKKHKFGKYKKWQCIDYQRAGTCSAMSLWSALYWFERESQQNLESFRLTLYLEVLKEASKELAKYREYSEWLDTQRLELVNDKHRWNELQSEIEIVSETEGDFLRFFSVAFNSAIRSIRHLHTSPKQGLDMTRIMAEYAIFYKSEESKRYWQLVKPNIDDLYISTLSRILSPLPTPSTVAPKISTKENDCVNEVNQAIKSKDPFNFVKAVIGGTDLECQSKAFLASIHFGADELVLQTHHEDLILRALAKEVRSLQGGRLPILKLIQRLIHTYGFKIFPIYDIPSNTKTNFTEESRQVFILDEDAELKQFAVNCGAFNLLGKDILAGAYDLVKSVRKALSDLVTRVKLEDTEEYKLHKNFAETAATELQSIDPHLYAQYLASLIWNAEETGIADYINLFKPSEGWSRNDHDLLEHASKGTWSTEEIQQKTSSDVQIKEK